MFVFFLTLVAKIQIKFKLDRVGRK